MGDVGPVDAGGAGDEAHDEVGRGAGGLEVVTTDENGRGTGDLVEPVGDGRVELDLVDVLGPRLAEDEDRVLHHPHGLDDSGVDG